MTTYRFRLIRVGQNRRISAEDNGGGDSIVSDQKDLITYLNEVGKEGWHVVSAMNIGDDSTGFRLLLEREQQ